MAMKTPGARRIFPIGQIAVKHAIQPPFMGHQLFLSALFGLFVYAGVLQCRLVPVYDTGVEQFNVQIDCVEAMRIPPVRSSAVGMV